MPPREREECVWQPQMLERYPMDSNAMVHGLDAERLDLLLTYVEETTMSGRLAEARARRAVDGLLGAGRGQ